MFAAATQRASEAEEAAAAAADELMHAKTRAASAEEAKIELSLKLAELVADRESAKDMSGVPSKKPSPDAQQILEQR